MHKHRFDRASHGLTGATIPPTQATRHASRLPRRRPWRPGLHASRRRGVILALLGLLCAFGATAALAGAPLDNLFSWHTGLRQLRQDNHYQELDLRRTDDRYIVTLRGVGADANRITIVYTVSATTTGSAGSGDTSVYYIPWLTDETGTTLSWLPGSTGTGGTDGLGTIVITFATSEFTGQTTVLPRRLELTLFRQDGTAPRRSFPAPPPSRGAIAPPGWPPSGPALTFAFSLPPRPGDVTSVR